MVVANQASSLSAYHREWLAAEAVIVVAVQREFAGLWDTLDLTGGVHAAVAAVRTRLRLLSLPVPTRLGRVMAATLLSGDLMGRWHSLRAALPEEATFAEPPDVLFDVPATWRTPAQVERAALFLFRKELMTRAEFNALTDRYRSAGFTIAGEQERRFLEIARRSLEGSLRRKLTVDQAADALNRALRRQGYDPLRPTHARIVAHMNFSSAYGAASYEQLHDPRIAGIIPAFRYVTMNDERVRPAHAAMEGFVAERDAQIWNVWWPPNGWGCRCIIVGVNLTAWEARGEKSDRWPRVDAKGKKVKRGGKAVYPDVADGISFAGNPSQYIRRKAA